MVTCANCKDEASYTYRISITNKVNYCEKHLPRFLANRKDSALLALDVPRETVVEPKASKKKSEPVVVEEPVVEEPVVEETVVEETPAED